MDASPVHTYKDTTPHTDISCREIRSPGKPNNKKRKRPDDHDHEDTVNPFFRQFNATVSLHIGKPSSATLTLILSATPTTVREVFYVRSNSPPPES